MPKNRKKATLITGPTASGKSALALKIAKERDGIIINADALQVYSTYQILTARPSPNDLVEVPHALYGHVDSEGNYSVGEWLREVTQLIDFTDKYPIIIGGTGLYFRALIEGLAEIPPISVNSRLQVAEIYENIGIDGLKERLENADPELMRKVDTNNHRRLMRALEVYIETGKPLSQWQRETPPPRLLRSEVEAIVICPEVEVTNERITKRFDEMMENGAVAEVEAQMPFDEKLPANQALGAKEIALMLEGKISRAEAGLRAIIATRQYAKRQRTWFRSHMDDWEWRKNPV